jgi:hypothetical protein
VPATRGLIEDFRIAVIILKLDKNQEHQYFANKLI